MSGLWRRYRPFLLVLLIWVLISVAGSVATGLVIRSGIDAQQARINQAAVTLRTGQIAACQRSDIQTAKDNKSQFADWTVDRLFVASITTPRRGESRAQRRAARRYLAPLRAAVAAKAWVPLIKDCRAEVAQHGSKFFPAVPIPFNERVPPKAQLATPPGIVPHPVQPGR